MSVAWFTATPIASLPSTPGFPTRTVAAMWWQPPGRWALQAAALMTCTVPVSWLAAYTVCVAVFTAAIPGAPPSGMTGGNLRQPECRVALQAAPLRTETVLSMTLVT